VIVEAIGRSLPLSRRTWRDQGDPQKWSQRFTGRTEVGTSVFAFLIGNDEKREEMAQITKLCPYVHWSNVILKMEQIYLKVQIASRV